MCLKSRSVGGMCINREQSTPSPNPSHQHPTLDEYRWHSRSILNLVLYHDANHYADDYKHNKNDEEANPSFFAGCTSRVHCLIGVLQSGNDHQRLRTLWLRGTHPASVSFSTPAAAD